MTDWKKVYKEIEKNSNTFFYAVTKIEIISFAKIGEFLTFTTWVFDEDENLIYIY